MITTRFKRHLFFGLLAIASLLYGTAAAAIDATRLESVTVEAIDERMAAVEANEGIATEMRESLIRQYLQAREALTSVETAMANASRLTKLGDNADTRVAEIDKAIAKIDRENDLAAIRRQLERSDTGPAQALIDAQIDFDSRRSTLNELERRMTDLRAAPLRIRDDIAAVERGIAATEQELDGQIELQPATPIRNATRWLALARLKAANAQLASLRAELSSLEPRTRILAREIALATSEQALAATRLEAARMLVGASTEERAAAGRAYLQEIRAKLDDAPTALEAPLRHNAELAGELVATIERTQKSTAHHAKAEEQLTDLEDRFAATRKRVDIAGTNPALAILLREERQRLPSVRAVTRELRSRITEINAISFRQIEVFDELRVDAESQLAALLQTLAADDAELHDSASDIIETRRLLLAKLAAAYSEYLQILSELDFSQSRTVEILRDYQAYLDERLLWLPSAGRFARGSVNKALGAITWLGSINNLRDVVDVIATDIRSHMTAFVLAVIALGVFLRFRYRLHGMVDELGALTKRARTDHFRYTIYAVGIVLMGSSVLPLVLYATGWRLEASISSSDFAAAAGAALRVIAPFVMAIYFLRQLARPGGIAAAQFHWDDRARDVLYRNLTVILYTIPLLYFFYVVLDEQPNPDHRESLGRLVLIVVSIGTALIIKRMFDPRSGIPARYLSVSENGLADNLKFIWYWLLIAIPVGLAIAAAAGYQYAANVLFVRLFASIGVAFAARIMFDLGVRWIAVVRRRLRFKIALENQAAAREKGEAESAAAPEVDLMEIDANSRQLIRVLVVVVALVGFWLLWRDVLPALEAFGNVDLWHYTQANSAETLAVSLQDLLVAFGLAILFALGARDIPAVLQIGILQRLSMDPGSRYAIRALLQYLIIGIGVAMVFSRLGFAWSQVQWLVAALGVGLGFGLQEIFANFVSGIIILFERPIRVGDLVSVDDVTGTVDRIRIRATTLTDFDRKEVIVPNRTFLTSRVVNWTLTDTVTRVIIPVGVSYGDDTEAARKIVLAIAQNHPNVLDKPQPQIYFRELGDSSLNFELWIYVNALTDRFPVTDEILMQVERELPKAGITIPFPQRDLHVAWPPEFGSEAPDDP